MADPNPGRARPCSLTVRNRCSSSWSRRRPPPASPPPVAGVVDRSPLPLRRKVRAYVELTKPRVIELLLVTTLPTMIFARSAAPDVLTMIATLVGGASPPAPPAPSTATSTATSTGS